MRWWMWVAAALGVVAIVALAAAWVALTTARADLERQDDRLESLERQPGTPAVIGDRLDALEGQIARLADVQSLIADTLNRIEALENQAPPTAPSLTPVLNRLDALEDRVDQLVEVQSQITDVLDRIEALENRAPPTAPSLTPVLDRIEALEGRSGGLEQEADQITSALERIADLAEQATALQTRIETLEARAPAGSESLAGALDRLAAVTEQLASLTARIATLEAQPEPDPAFIVANYYAGQATRRAGGSQNDLCISYTVPGGLQERCKTIHWKDGVDGQRTLEEFFEPTVDCYVSARIGEPLPDCWR